MVIYLKVKVLPLKSAKILPIPIKFSFTSHGLIGLTEKIKVLLFSYNLKIIRYISISQQLIYGERIYGKDKNSSRQYL